MNPVPGKDAMTLAIADLNYARVKLEAFAGGDDSVAPDPYDNLAETRREAAEYAKRYLRWVAMCDELLACSTSAVPK